jgi:hypothetical protein
VAEALVEVNVTVLVPGVKVPELAQLPDSDILEQAEARVFPEFMTKSPLTVYVEQVMVELSDGACAGIGGQ